MTSHNITAFGQIRTDENMTTNLLVTRTGKGTPLVFIHGWGLNSGIWQPLAEKLAAHYQVITIDLPGYGMNRDNRMSPYSLDTISEKIIETIEEPAFYIGWSLGGLFATDIATKFPEKVLGLVTVASSPCFVEKVNEADEVIWPGIKAPILNAFHQQLAIDTKKTINGFLKIQAMGSPQVRQNIKEIQSLIFQYDMPTQHTLEQSLLLLETVDLQASLKQIVTPFLRLYGRLDSLVPKGVIPLVNELMKEADISGDTYTFEHASHAPFISHANEFYQVINNWLSIKLKLKG